MIGAPCASDAELSLNISSTPNRLGTSLDGRLLPANNPGDSRLQLLHMSPRFPSSRLHARLRPSIFNVQLIRQAVLYGVPTRSGLVGTATGKRTVCRIAKGGYYCMRGVRIPVSCQVPNALFSYVESYSTASLVSHLCHYISINNPLFTLLE